MKKCTQCQKVYESENNFCKACGNKLISEKTKLYANFGKNGITSYTYQMANGVTINSKGNMTTPIANGMSYTTKIK
ncbi:MAG: hypothetical protein E7311_03420 [Clostridiales bacterium]|nr:hypothetical protein [Clostridiales bacterium]